MLNWEDKDTHIAEFVRAIAYPLNPVIEDLNGFLEAFIYVDDILASANNKFNMLRLLAATIEAIFTVSDCAHTSVHSLLKNGMNSWLVQSKPYWGSLLIRTSSQLESLLIIEIK
jgi:hypothetical protein